MTSNLTSRNFIKPKLLHRDHIKKKLDGIFNTPLFFIVSGMGFGKTTAVRNYIRKKRNIRYFWFMFDQEDTEDIWEWARFCKKLESMNSELSKKLLKYGLPYGKSDLDRLVDIVSSYIEKETVVIFDDVHRCTSSYLKNIIEDIALSDIKGLHIVAISRNEPTIDVDALLKKGSIKLMTQRNFEFSKLEMENFFILNDDPLSNEEIELLYYKTKGWIAGIYLALMHHKAYGSFDDMKSGTALMRSAVYESFNETQKRQLMILSKLDAFTLDQAEYIVGDNSVRDLVKRIYDAHCFTKYDAESGFYGFHTMLRLMLDEELAKSDISTDDIYERIGNYAQMTGNRIAAISAFSKCGKHVRVLDVMSERHSGSLMNFAPEAVRRAFDQMPMNVRLSRPFAYLTYIYSYSLNIDMQNGANMLREAKEFYINQRYDLREGNQIFGEIALIESIYAFNDLKEMFECYERANEYFDGGTSQIFDSDMIITFGVPLTMSLYHKRKGDMIEIVELVEREFGIFNHIANGCGAGFEQHLRAEYEYMTGNLEKAENLAYNALYKAQTRDQFGIILSISFLLVRLFIFQGRTREIDEILVRLVREIERYGNPIFLNCYEIIIGYMFAYMGRAEFVPQWLLQADLSQTKFMSPARDSAYLISAKIAMELGAYEKLEKLSAQLLDFYIRGEKAMGTMVFYMYGAIASYHLGNHDKAVDYMKKALAFAEADDCYVILSENVYTAIPLMKEIGTPMAFKIIGMAEKYAATKKLYSKDHQLIPLSKREREVMDLVCEGYTADAISKILFVSHSTIKKHISSAYSKLNVNKKSDAIAVYKSIQRKI